MRRISKIERKSQQGIKNSGLSGRGLLQGEGKRKAWVDSAGLFRLFKNLISPQNLSKGIFLRLYPFKP